MSVERLLRGKGNFVSIIHPGVLLSDVIAQLDVDNVGALVVTYSDGRIAGIITEHDVARALRKYGRDAVDIPLHEIMSTEVISIDVEAPLRRVLELMDEHQIHYVPVTKGDSLCGIINMLDLVRYRLAETESEAEALKEYISTAG
jgi:CBS domain-containing protein